MKREFLLIILLLVVGCEPGHKQTVSTSGDISQPKLKGVSFAGGNGSSIEKAVIIKAPNSFIGIRAEYDWIRKNHPDWNLEKQSALKASGKIYDKMDFQTPDGRSVTLFFDITDFFGKQ
jgi:hypothetical protein